MRVFGALGDGGAEHPFGVGESLGPEVELADSGECFRVLDAEERAAIAPAELYTNFTNSFAPGRLDPRHTTGVAQGSADQEQGERDTTSGGPRCRRTRRESTLAIFRQYYTEAFTAPKIN